MDGLALCCKTDSLVTQIRLKLQKAISMQPCASARTLWETPEARPTCVDSPWVAKLLKTCDHLRANLSSI